MRNDKNNIVKRKRDVILALLVVTLMIFGCITNVFAVGEDETESSEQQVTEQTEPQTSQEPTTEATEPPTQATTEAPTTTEATTEATEPTTVQATTEATQSTTYEEWTEVTEATTEGNPWDFEVPTEGTIEAEQTKADYFTGTVMWSAVGGGLLILLIMFIGKRKY